MLLVASAPAKQSHGQLEMYLEQNKYINAKLSTSAQKKMKKLLEKNIFKVVTPDKIIMPKEVSSSI